MWLPWWNIHSDEIKIGIDIFGFMNRCSFIYKIPSNLCNGRFGFSKTLYVKSLWRNWEKVSLIDADLVNTRSRSVLPFNMSRSWRFEKQVL